MPDLASKIGPVDLLLHETTYLEDGKPDAAKRGHSTARQAAKIALEAGAKALLTTHYSSRYYRDETAFATEASEVFPGPVYLNYEKRIIEVGKGILSSLIRKSVPYFQAHKDIELWQSPLRKCLLESHSNRR